MIILPYLTEEGYIEVTSTSGYLRQMPLALQHTMCIALLEHLSSDAVRTLKVCLRSPEDIIYMMETLGVCFGFSTAEYAASVKKTMDVYLTLFTAPVVTQLRVFEDQAVKETFLVAAIRQMSLVVEVRHDFPAGSVPHMQLIARVMDHLSKLFAVHEGQLAASTWSSILKVCLGMFAYACTSKLPSECRLTIASVAFEGLVRSKTRDPEVWQLFQERLPNTFATASQWSVVVVAFTRAVASLSTRRPLPPCLPLAWRGVIDPTRNVTNLISYTGIDEVTFMWKKLCVLINPLRLGDAESIAAATEAVRDSAMILSSASYWPQSMRPGGSDDTTAELSLCSRHIPLGVRTASVLRVWGDALLHLGMGSTSKLNQRIHQADLDDSRMRAVEGMCAVMLRRETELECPEEYWMCFVKLLDEICDGVSHAVRGHLLLHVQPLFLLDLPWPYGVIRKLCLFACEVLAEMSDSRLIELDEEDDDGAAAKPSGPNSAHTDEDAANAHQALLLQEALEMQRAAIAVVLNAAVVGVLHKDEAVVVGSLTALQFAAERFKRVSDVLQRCMSAATHIVRHASTLPFFHDKCLPMLSAMWSCSLTLLEAPAGTYDPFAMMVAMRFLAWNAKYISKEDYMVDTVSELATFCVAVRRMLDMSKVDQGDVITLSTLFSVACEVVSDLLCTPGCSSVLHRDATVAQSIVLIVDSGFKALRYCSMTNVRESANKLLRALEITWWWPQASRETSVSSKYSEADLFQVCSSVHCFGLDDTRIVTLLQIDPKALAADNGEVKSWIGTAELVMIVRSSHGRRMWLLQKHVAPREATSTLHTAVMMEPGSPRGATALQSNSSLSGMEPLSLGGGQDGATTTTVPSNVLRFVDEQERTSLLLNSWESNEHIRQLLETTMASSKELVLDLADINLPAASAAAVVQPQDSLSLLARQWIHDAGFPLAGYKPLPMTRSLISVLKGIDAIRDRPVIDVQVICVTTSEMVNDDQAAGGELTSTIDSNDAFYNFCSALGWSQQSDEGSAATSTSSRVLVHETPTEILRLQCSHKSIEGMSVEEDNEESDVKANKRESAAVAAAAASSSSDGVDNKLKIRPRIIWDASASRFDWTAADTHHHRILYSLVCPSMRTSRHTQWFDIVLRPLVQPGLYAISLHRPDWIALPDNAPALWGGPLLDNTIATAEALPGLLRQVLLHGVSDNYATPMANPRSIAIRDLLFEKAPLTSAQTIVAVMQ